jgi:hypothetical protein
MTVDLTYRYRLAELPLHVVASRGHRSLAGVGLPTGQVWRTGEPPARRSQATA